MAIFPTNSDYFRYLGAVCGGAIAFVSEYVKMPSKLSAKRKKIAELNVRLKLQEESHKDNKEKLIGWAIDKVLLLE